MRLLIAGLTLLTLGLSKDATEKQIKKIFNGLLAKEGITLTEESYEYRLAAFTINYWALSEYEKESIELMYDDEETLMQNGAKLAENLPVNEELHKRSTEDLLKKRISVPAFYDGRFRTGSRGSAKIINDVVHQGTCGNCYLHVFIAALELAYAKSTGKVVKFSEQEMTDCYDSGCEGGDYRMVAIFMSYIDKISERPKYGDYMNGQYTCKSEYTPDGLKSIKVVDYLPITTDTVEAAVVQYGSVMTCMAWSETKDSPCYMKTYGGGIYKQGATVQGGCDHAVLIVGYMPDYYIVRNSHGKTWGDEGYFIMPRGGNVCGIEEDMAALITEVRDVASQKRTQENGCPFDKPYRCEEINVCSREEECQNEITKLTRTERLKIAKRAVENSRLKKRRTQISIEEEVWKRQECADKTAGCAFLLSRGVPICSIPKYAPHCPKSCGKCAAREPVPPPLVDSDEKQGKCFKPSIANGKIENESEMLQPGEKLIVTCNAGFELVGPPVKCLIQDIYTNEVQDARLMPECIMLGSDELSGKGVSYTGKKSDYLVGGTSYQCGYWNQDVFRGVLPNDKEALRYKIGNHNFCRNPGGIEPVPFCIGTSSGVGKIQYCFGHPGCDACEGVTANEYKDECREWEVDGTLERMCLYTDQTSADQVSYYQQKCAASCCRIAGC